MLGDKEEKKTLLQVCRGFSFLLLNLLFFPFLRGGVLGGKEFFRWKVKRRVLLQRDKLAIRWASEQGVMSVDQFWRAVWWSEHSKGSSYASERILFLTRLGLLERMRTPFSLRRYFRATKKGAAVLDWAPESTLIPTFQAPINQIPHCDLLTELRLLVLHASKVQSWVTDRVLLVDPEFPKNRFQVSVPDAIWVTKKGRRVAVEYERTMKSLAKLRLKVESYSRELTRADSLIDTVLWISSPKTHRNLELLIHHYPNQRVRTFEGFKSEIEGGSSGGI